MFFDVAPVTNVDISLTSIIGLVISILLFITCVVLMGIAVKKKNGNK